MYTSSPGRLPFSTLYGGSVVKMTASSPRDAFAVAIRFRRYILLEPQ